MTSLTETMKMLLEDTDGKQKPLNLISEETIEDLRFSLQTINSRSEGLLVTSSVTLTFAHWALKKSQRLALTLWLGLTVALGVTFLTL